MTLEHKAPTTIVHDYHFTAVDHHRSGLSSVCTGGMLTLADDLFATAGGVVDLWTESRSEPLHTFKWGEDSLTGVKFNPVEVCCVFGSGC
jgi:hypothetical protein